MEGVDQDTGLTVIEQFVTMLTIVGAIWGAILLAGAFAAVIVLYRLGQYLSARTHHEYAVTEQVRSEIIHRAASPFDGER